MKFAKVEVFMVAVQDYFCSRIIETLSVHLIAIIVSAFDETIDNLLRLFFPIIFRLCNFYLFLNPSQSAQHLTFQPARAQ